MIELVLSERCTCCGACVDICPTNVFDAVAGAPPDAAELNGPFGPILKQFPAYLNRWDSQQARNEGVFAH
jgi:ferredoxin